jgi:hypothetical protein
VILGQQYLEEQLVSDGFLILQPERVGFTRQMDIYHKAEVLVFPEGSACHGVELLGTGALGSSHVLTRRDGHLDYFRRVLAPRSDRFTALETSGYLGSVFVDGPAGKPLHHLGVSFIGSEDLVPFLRSTGAAPLTAFNTREYAAAAERDLMAYLAAAATEPPTHVDDRLILPLVRALQNAVA